MAGQSEKKLARLMEKAEELFMKYGYNAVSVDQIASESGISKMTIYKHFPSKEELFIEVIMKISDFYTEKLLDKINEKYHTVEKIQAMYIYSLQMSSQFPPVLYKDILEHANIFEKVKEIKEKITLSIWHDMLEDGIKKGEIRPLDVDFVAELIMRLPMAFINTDYFFNENKRDKFLESLFDFMEYGMLGGIENQQHSALKEGADDGEKRINES